MIKKNKFQETMEKNLQKAFSILPSPSLEGKEKEKGLAIAAVGEIAARVSTDYQYDKLLHPSFASHNSIHAERLTDLFINDILPSLNPDAPISIDTLVLLFSAFMLHDIGMCLPPREMDKKDFWESIRRQKMREGHDVRSLEYIEKLGGKTKPANAETIKLSNWLPYWQNKPLPEPTDEFMLLILARICQSHAEKIEDFMSENALKIYKKKVKNNELFFHSDSYTYDFQEICGYVQSEPWASEPWASVQKMLCVGAALLSLCDLCDIGSERLIFSSSEELLDALRSDSFEDNRSNFLHYIGHKLTDIQYISEQKGNSKIVASIVRGNSKDDRTLLVTNAGPIRELLFWGNNKRLINLLQKYAGLNYQGAFARSGMTVNRWASIEKEAHIKFKLYPAPKKNTEKDNEHLFEIFVNRNIARLLCEEVDIRHSDSKNSFNDRVALFLLYQGLRATELWDRFDFSKLADKVESIDKRAVCLNFASFEQDTEIYQLLFSYEIAIAISCKLARSKQDHRPFCLPKISLITSADQHFFDLYHLNNESTVENLIAILRIGSKHLSFKMCINLISAFQKRDWKKKPLFLIIGSENFLSRISEDTAPTHNVTIPSIPKRKLAEAYRKLQAEIEVPSTKKISKTTNSNTPYTLTDVYFMLTGIEGLSTALISPTQTPDNLAKGQGALILLTLAEVLPEDHRTLNDIRNAYERVLTFLPPSIASQDYRDAEEYLRPLKYGPNSNGVFNQIPPEFFIRLLQEEHTSASWIIFFIIYYISTQYGNYNIRSSLFDELIAPNPTKKMVRLILDEKSKEENRIQYAKIFLETICKNASAGRKNLFSVAEYFASEKNKIRSTFLKLLVFQLGYLMTESVIDDSPYLKRLHLKFGKCLPLHLGMIEKLASMGYATSSEKKLFNKTIEILAKGSITESTRTIAIMCYDVLWKYSIVQSYKSLLQYRDKFIRDESEKELWDSICLWVHKPGSAFPKFPDEESINIARTWGRIRIEFNRIIESYHADRASRMPIEAEKKDRAEKLANV